MRSLGPRMEVAVAMTILGVGAAVVAAMHLTWPEPELPVMAYSVSGGGVTELQAFEITDVSGGAVELTPGSEGARVVRLSNPNSVEIVVLTLEAEPGQPLDAAQNQVSGCPRGVLTVVPMAEPVAIPPSGAVEVEMVVRIAHDVPNACTDLVFPLTYSGRAARA
ncbi:hypothetical protein ACFYOT_30910 [Saccharothrix saharensis]|uniref:hypothetical protein n=1 Tax=Saccharothrix saharensis TaxID=571190 RepID=UPI0036C978B6